MIIITVSTRKHIVRLTYDNNLLRFVMAHRLAKLCEDKAFSRSINYCTRTSGDMLFVNIYLALSVFY